MRAEFHGRCVLYCSFWDREDGGGDEGGGVGVMKTRHIRTNYSTVPGSVTTFHSLPQMVFTAGAIILSDRVP